MNQADRKQRSWYLLGSMNFGSCHADMLIYILPSNVLSQLFIDLVHRYSLICLDHVIAHKKLVTNNLANPEEVLNRQTQNKLKSGLSESQLLRKNRSNWGMLFPNRGSY